MEEEAETTTTTEPTETMTEAAARENSNTGTTTEVRPNTVTANVQDPPAAPADPNAEDFSWVNPKFVKEGKPDFKQMAESYKGLETALRNKGVPVVPESIDEYKYDFVEGLQVDEVETKAFKELSKDLGLTVDQYKGIMDAYEATYVSNVPDAEKTGTALKEVWKDSYDSNLNAANAAISAYLPDGEDITKYPHLANDPIFAQIMAKVGAELGEDTGVSTPTKNASAGYSKLEISEMMGAPDYWTNREKQKIVSDWYESNSK